MAAALAVLGICAGRADEPNSNEPGILEPVSSYLQGRDIRIPNTDQSIDGVEQSNIEGPVVYEDALSANSMLGYPISRVSSPNDDMRLALLDMAVAANAGNQPGVRLAANELRRILLGTTRGRIYDGFGMLNFNRWTEPTIGAGAFPPDAVPGEYKMKLAVDTGQTYVSPFDGEDRRIWEINVNMLYYDGQIDSDTFLVRFPFGFHQDDVLHVNYRIFSLVSEDFSPTMVMLDRREALDTVNFPFKGLDSVWVAFGPGQVTNLTVKYAPVRMIRGVYTWGWRVHPPRIQFMQPIYEIQNAHTNQIELEPQGESFATRNREDLTLDAIAEAAPEKKMWEVVEAVRAGATPATINAWLTDANQGPRGTWIEWADLAEHQTQLPAEAWEMLAAEDGLPPGQYGDYHMISVYMNNEMYGEGPFFNEVEPWNQGDTFRVKLINLDNHTHYFRNVDFSARLHDDIGRCCGGGQTSFEIMNFKPSYGAPKVAEMQFRAGWGFRPHHNVIEQQQAHPRGIDRVQLQPYTGGFGDFHYGYLFSEANRGGDFRFNPPPFIITDHDDPAPLPLRDFDGADGLLLGQRTEGFGVLQMCPQDPAGFCATDFGPTNPNGVLNWPSPADPTVPKTELRFPPFLRNPAQGEADAGDIIPPTGAWEPFLWINPYNGTLYNDPADPSQGYWADLTYIHGAPVYAGSSLLASIEMPRAAGQLFYQFDDLFHDNSIFSPHPIATGDPHDDPDVVVIDRVGLSGVRLRVKGHVQVYQPAGERAGWVSLFVGAAGAQGCSGDILAVKQVNPNGTFLFVIDDSGIPHGETVCVQSTIGGFDAGIVP